MTDLNKFDEVDNPNTVINKKLRQYFDGKIVRKDLTKSIKEGANVPIYVLEFLLGQYCSSDDTEIIEEGAKIDDPHIATIVDDSMVKISCICFSVKIYGTNARSLSHFGNGII